MERIKRLGVLAAVLAVSIGGAAAGALLIVSSGAHLHSTTPTPVAHAAMATSTPVVSTPQPTPTEPFAADRLVLLRIAGNGDKRTDHFNTASDWDLVWSYNCDQYEARMGLTSPIPTIFIITAMSTSGGLDIRFDPVIDTGTGKNGVQHYHGTANDEFLEVDSNCQWQVEVES